MAASPNTRELTAPRRSQAERSAAMRERLEQAAIDCLIEHGYARTTSVEVCRRAGVTRGALHHHFDSLTSLLVAVLERLYAGVAARDDASPSAGADAAIRLAWERLRQPEWKAVIEIWLAARNDPELGRELEPAIARLSRLFDPLHNPALARQVGSDPAERAFYRLAAEAMLGLALGRAVSPEGRGVEHEDEVIEVLIALARGRAARRGA